VLLLCSSPIFCSGQECLSGHGFLSCRLNFFQDENFLTRANSGASCDDEPASRARGFLSAEARSKHLEPRAVPLEICPWPGIESPHAAFQCNGGLAEIEQAVFFLEQRGVCGMAVILWLGLDLTAEVKGQGFEQ